MAPFGFPHRQEFIAEFIQVEIARRGFGVHLEEAIFPEKMMNHPGGRLRLASHHKVDDGSRHLQLSSHGLEIPKADDFLGRADTERGDLALRPLEVSQRLGHSDHDWIVRPDTSVEELQTGFGDFGG